MDKIYGTQISRRVPNQASDIEIPCKLQEFRDAIQANLPAKPSGRFRFTPRRNGGKIDTNSYDVLRHIFSYLNTGSDIVVCSQVCQNWRAAVLGDERYRVIRCLTYINAIGYTILHPPLAFLNVREIDQCRPDVATFTNAIARAKRRKDPCFALDYEVERLYDASVALAEREQGLVAKLNTFVIFLTRTHFFDLCMRKLRQLPDVDVRQPGYVDKERGFRELAVHAHAAGSLHIALQAASHCASDEADLPNQMRRQADLVQSKRYEDDVESAIANDDIFSLRMLYPFITSPSLQCKALYTIANSRLEMNDVNSAKQSFCSALEFLSSLEAKDALLIISMIALARKLSCLQEGEILIQYLQTLKEGLRYREHKQFSTVIAEAYIAFGAPDRGVEFVESTYAREVDTPAILAKWGYIDEAIAWVQRSQSRIGSTRGYVAIGEYLIERDPERACEFLFVRARDDLAFAIKNRITNVETIEDLVRIAKGLQRLGKLYEHHVVLEQIRTLEKLSPWTTTQENMNILVIIGEGFAQMGLVQEGRFYLKKASSCSKTERRVNAPADYYIEKVAEAQLRCGYHYDGKRTLEKLWKIKREKDERMELLGTSLKLAVSVLHQSG